jgi:hypothetical protein
MQMYIGCNKLMVNVDQQINLQKQIYQCRKNFWALCNYYWLGKAMSCTYSECGSLNLSNQHAKRLSKIIFFLCSLYGPTTFYTSTHKWLNFQKGNYWDFSFRLQIISETFLFLRRIPRDVIDYLLSLCTVTVIRVRFNCSKVFVNVLK